MNVSKMSFALVSLVVMVVVISSVAIPVMDDLQHDLRSDENNTVMSYMAASVDDIDISLTVSDSAVTVNGYAAPIPTFGTLYVLSDKMIVFGEPNGDVKIADLANGRPGSVIKSFEASDGDWSAVLSNDSEVTGTYTGTVYIISETGNYGLYTPANLPNAKFDSRAEFHVAYNYVTYDGGLSAASEFFVIGIDGTVKSSYGGQWTGGTLNVMEAGANINTTYDADTDTYTVNSIRGTLTSGDTTHSATTNSVFTILAPIAYEYIGQSDKMVISLIGIIPLMLIIVPVMYATRLLKG